MQTIAQTTYHVLMARFIIKFSVCCLRNSARQTRSSTNQYKRDFLGGLMV